MSEVKSDKKDSKKSSKKKTKDKSIKDQKAQVQRADQLLEEVSKGIDALPIHHVEDEPDASTNETIVDQHPTPPVFQHNKPFHTSNAISSAASNDTNPTTQHIATEPMYNEQKDHSDDTRTQYESRYRVGLRNEIAVQVGGDHSKRKRDKKKHYHHVVQPVDTANGIHYRLHHHAHNHRHTRRDKQLQPAEYVSQVAAGPVSTSVEDIAITKLLMKNKKSKILGYEFDHVA